MFTNILVPTDGSELAEKAFSAAIAFAKEVGARITGYYAMPPVGAQVEATATFSPRAASTATRVRSS